MISVVQKVTQNEGLWRKSPDPETRALTSAIFNS